MWGLNESTQPELSSLISVPQQYKIPALPLQFQYLPVQILSKEFTKLNSNHPYRIHYLGPRPLNTLILHKRYSQKIDDSLLQKTQQELKNIIKFDSYRINLKKIINSTFMNEKMQSNSHYKSSIFYRAFEGMNPYLSLEKEFIFNSAFESGNLDCAIKIKSNQFDLFLRVDSNTRGHTSWYYFSIKNGKKKEKIVINICNLAKPSSLYEQGMKPFVFSKKLWNQNAISWQQDSINQCKLEEARLRYEIIYESVHVAPTYKLSFQYQFLFEDDEAFFAYCIPYTYSQLEYDIQQYQKSTFVKKSIAGRTLTGLNLPILHISNHKCSEIKKKNIILTGRVHPGESNSSLILNGFILYLIGSSKQAQDLRNRCNFFIIPMLNPDGVVLGNTRASAAGKDLNREFLCNKKDLYPEIHAIKSLTVKLQKKFGVTMYIDFHGHSRKKNTFLYGPNYPLSHAQYYRCRAFPRIVEKIDSKFRFYSCSFSISQQKKSTARAVMLNQMKIVYSYTIQSSIGLYYNPQIMKTEYFNAEAWNEMGINIGSGLSAFLLSLIDLDLYLIERRSQRAKIKQQKALQLKFNRFKQDQAQNLQKNKRNPLLQIFEQIKIISAQLKQFQQQVQSDDHDEDDDLQSFKLKQFNNLVIKGCQRLKNTQNIIEDNQQEQFNIVTPNIAQQDQQQPTKMKMQQVQKKTFSLIKNNKIADIKISNNLNFDQVNLKNQSIIKKQRYSQKNHQQKIKKIYKNIKQKDQQEKLKLIHEQKNKKQSKNFILSNKQRYSVTSKFTYPLEDRCQIVTLPKSIQIMRRQMKKGRMLINNIQDSRSKLLTSKTIQPKNTQNKQDKISFLYSDLIKLRQSSRSSAGNIIPMPQSINHLPYTSRKSQMNLIDPSTYMALNALELDNMAMTITTFRSYK